MNKTLEKHLSQQHVDLSRRYFLKLSVAGAAALATNPLMAYHQAAQQYAFVGSYTGFEPAQLPWVGSKRPGEGILCFSFNSSDGSLTPTGKLTKQDSPTWLEIHPNRQFLVATHELSHHTGVAEGVGFVTSYKILPDGGLEKVVTQATGGRGNTSATFDRTGRFLLVTRYWESGISVLPFDPETGKNWRGDSQASSPRFRTGSHSSINTSSPRFYGGSQNQSGIRHRSRYR